MFQLTFRSMILDFEPLPNERFDGRENEPPLTSKLRGRASLAPWRYNCIETRGLSKRAGVSPGSKRSRKTLARVSVKFQAFLAMSPNWKVRKQKFKTNYQKLHSLKFCLRWVVCHDANVAFLWSQETRIVCFEKKNFQKKEKILLSVEALTLVWTLTIKKNRLKQVHTWKVTFRMSSANLYKFIVKTVLFQHSVEANSLGLYDSDRSLW